MRIFLIILFVLPAIAPAQKIRVKPTAATLTCGSDIEWQPSVEEAFEAAAKAKRPVFWYVPTVRRSRMDRKPEIDHYMMAGPFSSPLVAELLNRKFVPVKEVARGEHQETYGLHHGKFIEPGFIILAPDGKEILRLDKLTTLNSEWIAWQIRRALSKRADLSADSDAVASARKSKNDVGFARALLEEGDALGAAAAMPLPAEKEAPELRYLRGQIAAAQRDISGATKHLAAVLQSGGSPAALAAVEAGRLALAQGLTSEAAAHFQTASKAKSSRRDEAHFFAGVCHFAAGDHEKATAVWKKLGSSSTQNRWTRKASAEAQRLGPFSRCFERFDWIPREAFSAEADGTRWPREKEHLDWLVNRSVKLLLATQSQTGVWDDSNYDFGGTDSLPNVYVAGTALAARALLEYPEVAGAAGEEAVQRAFRFVSREGNLALKDKDEIIWAHAYRLLFFEKLIADNHPLAAKAKKKAREVVKTLSRTQLKSGAWRHEYPNPFATATTVLCLSGIARVQVPIGKQMLDKAGGALEICRAENGAFSYGMPRRRGRSRSPSIEGSAGRMPICELALLQAGRSTQKKLQHAIETSFKHHHLLEKIRKYDDHADRFGNGGFFFWHDILGRTEAIRTIQDPALRKQFQAQELDLILSIPEIDGGFVDSHELGKTYGTAMGLLCIKALMPAKP